MYDYNQNTYYSGLENRAMNNQHFNAAGSNFYGADNMMQQRVAAMVSQPFSIQMSNTSTNQQTSVLWDAANSIASGSGGNYGNNAAITISVVDGQYSYAQMLWLTTYMSIQIARVEVEGSTTSTVVNNPVTFTTFSQFGEQRVISKLPGLNKFQQLNSVVTVDYVFPLDPLTKVTQILPASAVIIYRFYPAALINGQHALNGNQPTQVFANPRNQGVPQLYPEYGMPENQALLLGH